MRVRSPFVGPWPILHLFAQLLHAGGVRHVDALLGVVGRRRAATFDAQRRRLASHRVVGSAEVEQLVLGNDTSGSGGKINLS